MQKISRKKSAFSLLELSISLSIIAILITGISISSKLVRESKLNKVIHQAGQLEYAISSFVTEYKSLPGDMSNASSFWSSASNGDGDGSIEFRDMDDGVTDSIAEVGRVMKHLSLAGLISGSFSTGATLGTNPSLGLPSAIEKGVFILTNQNLKNYPSTNNNHIAGSTENTLRIGRYDSDYTTNEGYVNNVEVGYGLFTVAEAMAIDQKTDDGLARSGRVSGSNQFSREGGIDWRIKPGCLKFTGNADTISDGTGSYNNGTNYKCNISFDLRSEN